jgi:hypothetical protein
MGGRLGILAVIAAIVSACSTLPPPVSAVAPIEFGYANGTRLEVAVVINGRVVSVLAPGDGSAQVDAPLPALPWHVEARTSSGRVLGSFDLAAGQATCEPVGDAMRCAGALIRVDLSCGRLDIWAGVRPSGPVPGPGVPGDCVP